MGLEYRLECEDDGAVSEYVEFSVIRGYQVKTIPDDYEMIMKNWMPFLVKHSGHKIALVDARGQETDPAKITGAYVVGLEDYNGVRED